MGGFFYHAKPSCEQKINPEKYARSLQALENKAFSEQKRLGKKETIERDNFIIHLYDKIGVEAENSQHYPSGEFIIATGTFIYKNETGKKALRRLFEDFDKKELLFNDFRGNYCILIYKNSRLYVFNDLFGIYHVYTNSDCTVISNSFLSVVRSLDKKEIAQQPFYEYIIDGTSYADETWIKGVYLLDAFCIHEFDPSHSTVEKKYEIEDYGKVGFEDSVSITADNLLDYFSTLKSCFGDNVCCSLSGGYDSRLILALLTRTGINPYAYVYGHERSADVRTAKLIGEGEDITVHHDPKNKPITDIDEYHRIIRQEYYYCDGQGPVGAFTNGAEMRARRERTRQAALQLNGGGGEIFRNFWKLPDREFSVHDFINSIYSVPGRKEMTEHYNNQTFNNNLVEKVKRMLRSDSDILTRTDLEKLYVYMRVKYWTGYNTSIQNYRAFALIPLTDPLFAFQSFALPVSYKDAGRYEAAIIRKISKRLAGYSSIYGYNFYNDPPLSARLINNVLCHVPMLARPVLRAIRSRLFAIPVLPFHLQSKNVNTIINNNSLLTSEYVDIEKIHDPQMISRVYTVNLVMEDPY